MRKIAIIIFILILSSCSKNDDTIQTDNTTDIAYVADSFLTQFEEVREKNFDNLDFTNAILMRFPEASEIFLLEIDYRPDREQRIVTDADVLEEFELLARAIFGDSFDVENFNVREGDTTWITYRGRGDNPEDITQYLWWSVDSYFPHWLNRGVAMDLIEVAKGERILGWTPSISLEDSEIARYINDGTHNDKVYRLLDGDMSIGDAVNFFENELLNTLPYDFDENLSLVVNAVGVYHLKDDIHGFQFDYIHAWKGMPFVQGRSFTSNTATNRYNRYEPITDAFMVQKDEIDVLVNLLVPVVTELGQSISDIISLENAAEIVSEALSNAVTFDVLRIEFIYDSIEEEDTMLIYASPAWKFTLFNPNDNLHYSVYVDAINGSSFVHSFRPSSHRSS